MPRPDDEKARSDNVEAAGAHFDDELIPIGVLAARFKLSLRTLRFYEDRGLLQSIRRGPTLTRLYTSEDCRRLEIVLRGKSLGFTLAEIQNFLDGVKGFGRAPDIAQSLPADVIATQLYHLEQQRAEIDQAIAILQEALEESISSDDDAK